MDGVHVVSAERGAYRILVVKQGRVFVSKDVLFFEKICRKIVSNELESEKNIEKEESVDNYNK